MIDFGLDFQRRKPIEDLNVVPVLDMFIAIIFFLLLTTTFVGFTKLQVPPASVTTQTDPNIDPPLAPKFLLAQREKKLLLSVSWEGLNPGSLREEVNSAELAQNPRLLFQGAEKILNQFNQRFPNEKTIQMGMNRKAPFQFLIDLMDAAREIVPDIVLISFDEAEALIQSRQE